ncbi:SusC/RagA family TonB-linked outer membrane protein [Desertivirga arenae]|uniref:SusC/RagA family TonB-linked outer membrane protein n=1 Tax=Desertivirga arenae TaxID=2810309 RepID=UPI001A95AC9F|nr:SusC/RagA family TonB-linked outer membrane protein [Pedobacter sp. SYSU D00823]
MKLTLGLLLVFNFHALAGAFSQTKVTLNLKSVGFQDLLSEIEAKTVYRFVFSNRNIPAEQKVDVRVKDAEVSKVLNQVLQNSSFTYNILESNLIVIVPKENLAQAVIKGRVIDETGQPLIGAAVKVKGGGVGTSTDVNGNFSVNAADNAVLVISYIGYITKEVPVNGQSSITVRLDPAANNLKEIVVTSLGIKREQKALGYSVSTFNSKDLTEAANTNVASALYGKAPGVTVTTAPGGASSAVNVQIRGINSLNYNKQPLYVVDGIMIRNDNQNGAAGANNDNYWDDQRIRGNGILDINPADVESMTILKGASATALYGSDAASGVIVITTKKGSKDRGLGVDFNYAGSLENAAFLPKFQNIYGPGYDRATNVSAGGTAEGWIPDATSPSGYRPYFRAYGQFGPKMEGQQVKWWDGSIRSYSAQPDNYKDVFDNGYSSNFNLSLSNQSDKLNYRLSATRLDYKGTNPGSKQEKNTFNLNSTLKLSNKLSTDVVVGYINTLTHNRPYQLGQVLGSFGGFFSRTEDMSLMKEKFQTSQGYKYVQLANASQSPEAFIYNIRATNLLDFYWNQYRNSYDETENRLLSSITANWDVAKHLKLRGRIGNDYTALNIENRQYNEVPTAYNQPTSSTGGYNISKGYYSILYGDALLTYANKAGKDIDFSVTGGFQSRTENYKDQGTNTASGLVTENWFSISNSYAQATTTATNKELLQYAGIGIANVSFKDYLYLEGTARKEYVSSLAPGYNDYFYSSINSGFVFSDAFKMPSFISFGKLRASYGVVGNGPPMYEGNVAYTQKSIQTENGSVPVLTMSGVYGNRTLEPEKKYETEFGMETRFLKNRVGFDISYYDNTIKNQILQLQTSTSVGATGQIVNIGKIGSKGVELSLFGTPVSGALKWNTRLNFSSVRTRLHDIDGQSDQLTFKNTEQSSLLMVAKRGGILGDILVYPRATDGNGNYLISDEGYYVMDKSRYIKVGNIMPKATGGLTNSFNFKRFNLDFTVDYRLGGQMISNNTKYMMGAGMFENTLQYRDAEHGGLQYTVNGVTYNDGVLLKGVNQKTGAANTAILSAADYYLTTFGWGGDALNEEGSVFDNSFIKMREAVLGYTLPASVSNKMHVRNLRIALIGRNLFYLWKTLDNLDPEAVIGNRWYSQGYDVGSTAATRSFGFTLNAQF